jgi:hypothetical protein
MIADLPAACILEVITTLVMLPYSVCYVRHEPAVITDQFPLIQVGSLPKIVKHKHLKAVIHLLVAAKAQLVSDGLTIHQHLS